MAWNGYNWDNPQGPGFVEPRGIPGRWATPKDGKSREWCDRFGTSLRFEWKNMDFYIVWNMLNMGHYINVPIEHHPTKYPKWDSYQPLLKQVKCNKQRTLQWTCGIYVLLPLTAQTSIHVTAFCMSVSNLIWFPNLTFKTPSDLFCKKCIHNKLRSPSSSSLRIWPTWRT
jgi:hypothetical protein